MPDSNGVGFASSAVIANVDVVIAGRAIDAGVKAYCNVIGASGVGLKSTSSHGRVVETVVERECVFPVGCVAGAGHIINQRVNAGGSITGARGVQIQRLKTGSRIVVARNTASECTGTDGRVLVADSIVIERTSSIGSVAVSAGVVKKRINPGSRIIYTSGVAKASENRWPCFDCR